MSAKSLHPVHLPSNCRLAHLQPRPELETGSPASHIMLDFRLHPVPTLAPGTPLVEAQHFLNYSHCSVLLVVDRFDQLRGIATKYCLSSQAIMRLISQGRRRADLQVGDLMQPKRCLTAVNLREIENATIGEVLSLLRHEGVSHVLIVDDTSGEIAGLLSAPEIEQVLDLKLDISRYPSFLDIFNAVMH